MPRFIGGWGQCAQRVGASSSHTPADIATHTCTVTQLCPHWLGLTVGASSGLPGLLEVGG